MFRDRLKPKDNAAANKMAEVKVFNKISSTSHTPIFQLQTTYNHLVSSLSSLTKRLSTLFSCFQLETIKEPEPPLSPLLPPTTPGGFVFKTEAELEEQILKEIDLNRKKIREKRAEKRRKQELEGIENLSPER